MYFKVGEIYLFYKKYGSGDPILLLHGNGEDHTIFDQLIKQLEPHYTVYAIDNRGHGKSSKVVRLDYKEMMEDIAAFIDGLDLNKPIVYGFSDGGIVGLLLSIHYPDRLSKLILSGVNLNPFGLTLRFYLVMVLEYLKTGSDAIRLMLTQPHISAKQLRRIQLPVYLTAGEKDLIKYSHTLFIASNLRNSRLTILKSESHESYVIHNEKLFEVIKNFLCDKL